MEAEQYLDFTIVRDDAHTEQLNAKVRAKFGPRQKRDAVHASDLFYCLRKAHATRRLSESQLMEVSDDTLLTWLEGLMFEDLVSTGEKQKAAAYCFHCRTVSRIVPPVSGPADVEPINCSACGKPWLMFTPDYIDAQGIIHEVKQTRKSQRRGPEDAPWWIEQLATYLLFGRLAGWTTLPYARLVTNWIMGDYGNKKKGTRPRPPQSMLDSYLVIFREGFEARWESELLRRMAVVLNDEQPPLTGMGEAAGGSPRTPVYSWECATCKVGLAINCERYLWTEEGIEIGGPSDAAEETEVG